MELDSQQPLISNIFRIQRDGLVDPAYLSEEDHTDYPNLYCQLFDCGVDWLGSLNIEPFNKLVGFYDDGVVLGIKDSPNFYTVGSPTGFVRGYNLGGMDVKLFADEELMVTITMFPDVMTLAKEDPVRLLAMIAKSLLYGYHCGQIYPEPDAGIIDTQASQIEAYIWNIGLQQKTPGFTLTPDEQAIYDFWMNSGFQLPKERIIV